MCARCCLVGGFSQALERRVQLHHRRVGEARPRTARSARRCRRPSCCARPGAVSALVGDLVDLLAALFGHDAREAEVLEHRQRRVDGAWARRVRPAEATLELLDDLVAVARLLVEQAQDDVLEVALLEQPTGAPTPMRPSRAAGRPSRQTSPSPSGRDGPSSPFRRPRT